MARLVWVGALLVVAVGARAELMQGAEREAFQQRLRDLREQARATLFPLKMKDGALILDFDVLKAVTKADLKAHEQPMLSGGVGYWNASAECLHDLVYEGRIQSNTHMVAYGIEINHTKTLECDLKRLYFRREEKISNGPKKKDYLLLLAEGSKEVRVRALREQVGCELRQSDGTAVLTFYLEDGTEVKTEAATAAECLAKDAALTKRYFTDVLAGYDLAVLEQK